jgi:hypothetical protein
MTDWLKDEGEFVVVWESKKWRRNTNETALLMLFVEWKAVEETWT